MCGTNNSLIVVELAPEEVRRIVAVMEMNEHGGDYPQQGCILCAVTLRLQMLLDRHVEGAANGKA